MAAEGRWLLFQNCSGGIIDYFEIANIDMNMTKQAGFNSDNL